MSNYMNYGGGGATGYEEEPNKIDNRLQLRPIQWAIIIVNVLGLLLLLAYFIAKANEEVLPYATFEEVIENLQDDGYKIVEGRVLDLNDIYNHSVTSEVTIKVVASRRFAYSDNASVPNEIIIEGNEAVDVGAVNSPFNFRVRSLEGYTNVVTLYKMSNGSFKTINAYANGTFSVVQVLFWIVLIIIDILLIKKQFFTPRKSWESPLRKSRR